VSVASIVVVEDNPGDVYLLELALQRRNIAYQLTRYQDGEEAIRAVSADGAPVPDLILVDLNLPRREGFDVLRVIRRIPRFVGVPLGVFTSSETPKDRHRSALVGAVRYIHKPPTLDEFIEQVGSAVEDMLKAGPGASS
jgi:chemotaxis family two-component system response regulator Rcp1